MSKAWNVLKTAGYFVAKQAGKDFLGKVIPKTSESGVTLLRSRLQGVVNALYTNEHEYDDPVAVFLADLFGLDLPEKP